jgi:hypothetical protein
MKATLYYLVMHGGAWVIQRLNDLTHLVAVITNAIATKISPSTAEIAESILNQQEELSELSIMQRMVFLKEKAVEDEDWSQEQTSELNYLAYMLHDQHGWDTETIDTYVAQLVAAGPEGYEYGSTDDED